MLKRSLLFGMTALLAVSFIFLGCKGGEAGSNGATGDIVLSGEVTEDAINYALESGKPVVFAGATLASGTAIITRAVTLFGNGLTVTSGNIVVTGDYLKGNGKVVADFLIAPTAALAKAAGATVKIPAIAASSITDGVIPLDNIVSNNVGILGNVTIIADADTPAAGQIKDGQFSGNTVYISGNLSITKPVSATAINVVGNVTQDAASAVTGAVVTTGNFESAVTSAAAVSGVLTVGGNATFTGAVAQLGADSTVTGNLTASGATSLTALSAAKIKVDGNLSVTGNLILSSATTDALTVGGPATIGGNITTGSGASAIGFSGDVTLGATTLITATGADVITLAAGKAIKVGTDTVLRAGSAAPALLTFVDSGTLQAAAKKITTGGAIFTVTSGELIVAAGATLELGKFTNVVSGKLTLEGTAVLALPATGSTAKLTLGDTTVAGATAAATFTASGGSVTLEPDAITGAGTAPKLAIAGDDATITVAPGNGNSKTLTLTSVNIDLTTKGIILLSHASSSTENEIVLVGGSTPGKITLDSASETTNVGASHYVSILKTGETAKKAAITGTSPVVKGATDSAGTKAGSVAAGGTATTNDITLTGVANTNDVTLDNTAIFADA